MKFNQVDLFTSGQEGYHTFRIPALAVTTQGTLLAFAEGESGPAMPGAIDFGVKRSVRQWRHLATTANCGHGTGHDLWQPLPRG